LVDKAITLGKPFIFVSLNYRLGYFGFLASKELREDSLSHDEDYVANQGLNDQRLGLEWVGLVLISKLPLEQFIDFASGTQIHSPLRW
jgi:hypothetical protein